MQQSPHFLRIFTYQADGNFPLSGRESRFLAASHITNDDRTFARVLYYKSIGISFSLPDAGAGGIVLC